MNQNVVNLVGGWAAGTLLKAEFIPPEGCAGHHIVTVELAATLRLGHALVTATQEAIVTGAGLHTIAFTRGGSVLILTRRSARTSTLLIVAVVWTRGLSC